MLKGVKLHAPLLLLDKSEVSDEKIEKVSRHLGRLPSQTQAASEEVEEEEEEGKELNVYVLLCRV